MRILLLVLMSLTATTVLAKSPWYVGGGIGMSLFKQDEVALDLPDVDFKIDTWEPGFQLFGGYQLGEKWAIEAGYIDFGEADDFDPDAQIIGIGYALESAGVYVNGQYHIPLAKRVSLDLSGGWFFGETDAREVFPPNTQGTPQTDSYKDNGVMLGAAITWQANDSLYLRLPINYFAVDYDNTLKNPVRIGLDLIWNF